MNRVLVLTVIVLMALAAAPPGAAQVYDPVADFLPVNPNGVWRYGMSYPAVTSLLQLYTVLDHTTYNGVPDARTGWHTPNWWESSVWHVNVPYVLDWGGYWSTPYEMTMHPGWYGDAAHVRWTAPENGPYAVQAQFTAQDRGWPTPAYGTYGTTTDVHVLINNSPVFNGAILGVGASALYSPGQTFNLRQGDTVDFAVGFGPDGRYEGDSTGVSATIVRSGVPLTPGPNLRVEQYGQPGWGGVLDSSGWLYRFVEVPIKITNTGTATAYNVRLDSESLSRVPTPGITGGYAHVWWPTFPFWVDGTLHWENGQLLNTIGDLAPGRSVYIDPGWCEYDSSLNLDPGGWYASLEVKGAYGTGPGLLLGESYSRTLRHVYIPPNPAYR